MHHNTTNLIPAKFLILTIHFTVCVCLLWNSEVSTKACLMEEKSEEMFQSHHNQLVIGLSVAIGLICFELLVFVIGLTMFHYTSALLSISCHSLACFLLVYLSIDEWQCKWFWWIFTLTSVFPILNDICVVFDVLIKKAF